MQIAVLASGGDAPGTNAAVRARTRRAFARRWVAPGAETGYRELPEAGYPASTGLSSAAGVDNVIGML